MGELASGLTCACLPTLRPLITRYAPWMSSQKGSSFHHSSSATGKDMERGILGRASSSCGASTVRVNNTTNWPLPMLDTPGVTGPVVQRVDSGGDTSDGVFGLQSTRYAMKEPDPPIEGVMMSGSMPGSGSQGRSLEKSRQTSPRPSLEDIRPGSQGPSLQGSRQNSQRPSLEQMRQSSWLENTSPDGAQRRGLPAQRPSLQRKGGSSRKGSQESVRWRQPVVQD